MNSPLPRRWLALLAAWTAIILALTGCAGTGTNRSSEAPSGRGDKVTIGLTYVPNIQFAPFYVAETNGYYANSAELRHHGEAEGLFTALIAGDEEFVIAGGDEVLQAAATADMTDLVAVAPYYIKYPARIIVKANSPIQTLADLRGKTIGLPGKFGENWFALLVGLNQAGLTEQDVTIAEIGYTQQAALTTDKVDAIVGFANGDAVTFEQSGVPIRSIELVGIDPTTGAHYGESDLVSICIVTTKTFAEANPDIVKSVVLGTQDGIADVRANPDQAIETAKTYIPSLSDPDTETTARAVLTATIDLLAVPPAADSDLRFPPQDADPSYQLVPSQWNVMADLLTSSGILPETFVTEKYAGQAYMSNMYNPSR